MLVLHYCGWESYCYNLEGKEDSRKRKPGCECHVNHGARVLSMQLHLTMFFLSEMVMEFDSESHADDPEKEPGKMAKRQPRPGECSVMMGMFYICAVLSVATSRMAAGHLECGSVV